MLPIGYEIPAAYHWHAVALALLVACMGWVLYRFGMRVAGFSVGVLLGASLGFLIPQLFHHPEAQLWAVPILAIVLGIVCSAVVMGVVRLVIFLAVFMITLLAGSALLEMPLTAQNIGNDPAAVLILLGAGLIAGLLGVWLQRYLIIVLTVWMGSSLMAHVLPHPATFPVTIALGLAAQLGLYRRLIPKRTPEGE